MIDRALTRVSKRREIDEFVLREVRHTRHVSTRDALGTATMTELDHALTTTIYRNFRQGRGQASFRLGVDQLDDYENALGAAAIHASSSLGPAWSLPPAAAVARVKVFDPPLLDGDPNFHLGRLIEVAEAAAAAERLQWARLEVSVEIEAIELAASTGFRVGYRASMWTLRGSLGASGEANREEILEMAGRRVEDLQLADALAIANRRMRLRAQLARTAAGQDVSASSPGSPQAAPPLGMGGSSHTVDLVVPAAVLASTVAGGAHGWLSGLVGLASEESLRLGLSAFVPGQPIRDNAQVATPPLSLVSDGTLAFGVYSAPCGELGEPVRRFTIIDQGVARETSLSSRLAARRGRTANSGARNLSLSLGDESESALLTPGKRPLLRVHSFALAEVQPRAGSLSIQLDLCEYLRDGSWLPVGGGSLWIDAVGAWLSARRANEKVRHSWYEGPTLVRFDAAALRF